MAMHSCGDDHPLDGDHMTCALSGDDHAAKSLADDHATSWYDSAHQRPHWITIVTPWIAVTLGGGLGAGLRGWLSSAHGPATALHAYAGIAATAWLILAVNLLGSALLGFTGARCQRHGWTNLKLLVGTGFCGGLTTYSSFAVTVAMMAGISPTASPSSPSHLAAALLYAALTILGCAFFAWLGILLEGQTTYSDRGTPPERGEQ